MQLYATSLLKTEFLIFPPAKCVLPFTHSFKLESWRSFYTLFHSPSPHHLACYLPYPITNFYFFVSSKCISNSSAASPPLPPPWFQCHHLYAGVHITCLLPRLSPPISSPNNSQRDLLKTEAWLYCLAAGFLSSFASYSAPSQSQTLCRMAPQSEPHPTSFSCICFLRPVLNSVPLH